MSAGGAIFDPASTAWVRPAWLAKIERRPAPLTNVLGDPIIGGDCCVWLGGTNASRKRPKEKSYGVIHVNVDGRETRFYIHRFSFACHHEVELWPSIYIDHLCRVRRCWNPYHLESVEPLENLARGDGPKFQFKSSRHIVAGQMDDLPF